MSCLHHFNKNSSVGILSAIVIIFSVSGGLRIIFLTMPCLKCRSNNEGESIICDGCDRRIHVSCSSLSANEVKVMTLRGGKRTLKFFCDDCLEGIRIVPKLLQKLDALEEKLNQMISEPRDSTPLSEESVTCELMERQKRSSNIVIFNMAESDNDVSAAKEVFTDLINRSIDICSATRVGKKNKRGVRALKVTCKDPATASDLLRCKKDPLKGRNIYISADLTPSQRTQLNVVKAEFLERKNNGEQNIMLKYINNIPKIVVKKPLN